MSYKASRDQAGASAVEYGLIVVAIAAVVAIVVFALGLAVQGLFTNTCHAVNSRIVGSCS